MTKRTETSCQTAFPAPSGPRYSFLPPPSLRRRIQKPGGEDSMTRQEFKDDCDINRILKRFQLTGALSHFARFAPQYMEVSCNDFQEAQNLMIRARQMFDALPSAVRKECATPEGFLAFVSDPANAERMAELGLRERKPNDPAPPVVPSTPGASSPPASG